MTKFLKWWNRPVQPVIQFLFTGMDLKTWRETPEFLSFARELWTKPEWQHALSALRNAAPSGYPIRGRTISETDAALELGRKEGYQDCLNAIFSLPLRSADLAEEVEADFDPKDYSKTEE
jgi:hypothetical protein